MRDLNDLVILERVAVRLSLDAAARDLGLSPSTVSRRLTALEQRLGHALVHRTSRAVRLTAAGKAYAERCREVCNAADRADAVLLSRKDTFSGELSVNAPHLFGRIVLAPILFTFAQRHPAVRIRLSLSNAYIDPVSEGVDVVFRTGELSDSRLRARKLAEARMCVVASAACIAAHGEPSTLAEVAEKPCLVFGDFGSRWRCGSADGLPVRIAFAADDLEVIRDAAVAGLGFALLPVFVVAAIAADRRLRRLDLHGLGANPVHTVFPGHKVPNRCARALSDAVAGALAQDPSWRTMARSVGPSNGERTTGN